MTASESLVWLALIAACQVIILTILGGIGTGIQIWWANLNAKAAAALLARDRAEVAVRVNEVKTTLEATKATTDAKLDALHEIANGQTLIHLRLTAANSGIIAELLGREAGRTKDAADKDAAKVAKEQHETDKKNVAQHEATLKALSDAAHSAPAAGGKHVTIEVSTPKVIVNKPKEPKE